MLFDFETLSHTDRGKLLIATVVPRPIAWVVTQDRQGVLNAAPYSFFNCFGDSPAVLAIGIGHRPAGAKDTLRNVEETGELTVCLVPEGVVREMVATAADFGPEVDEISTVGLTTAPSSFVRPPRIAESPVAMECTLYQIIPIGTHRMLLAEVRAMHVRDDAVMDPKRCYIDTPALGLLGRMHGGGWYARTTDRLEVPRITAADWQARPGKQG
jgi:flavin reductase (DIM6/NTAB) family NADH-FMN oxidoreductase RutF